jgi:hypothetical protein
VEPQSLAELQHTSEVFSLLQYLTCDAKGSRRRIFDRE